jgi:glycosyltransferase involved in cell wall biosynthesis
MRVLWLTWKDIQHPDAGGAEVVSSELAGRLVRDGHEVILVTAGYSGAKPEATIDGYKVIRNGGRFSVYWQAYRYVKRHLREWPDIVVEEINTIPFCSRFYLRRKPRVLFFHMLCREIWFHQMPLPAGLVGYLAEPLYLRLLSRDRAIAMSESTKRDLQRYGFRPAAISVISEGIQLKPLKRLDNGVKYKRPTLVSLGSIRPMKRTLHQIRAFERAKAQLPQLQLKIAGDASGSYGRKVLRVIGRSPYRADIEYLGRISSADKQTLLQKAHLIAVTSVKEGWGLIVTEAASQGTPAVVYDVDGLRDSVQDGQTGLITEQNNPQHLAEAIVTLLTNQNLYATISKAAWEWSQQINFETSYAQFKEAVEI